MPGFEENLKQLESVVQRLEQGELTLEESVALFERGTQLSQSCRSELEQAEGRLQVLLESKSGGMTTKDLELEEPAGDEDERQT